MYSWPIGQSKSCGQTQYPQDEEVYFFLQCTTNGMAMCRKLSNEGEVNIYIQYNIPLAIFLQLNIVGFNHSFNDFPCIFSEV